MSTGACVKHIAIGSGYQMQAAQITIQRLLTRGQPPVELQDHLPRPRNYHPDPGWQAGQARPGSNSVEIGDIT